MDVDGQAAVGDQLTTSEGDLLSSDRVRWRMGATAAKCATHCSAQGPRHSDTRRCGGFSVKYFRHERENVDKSDFIFHPRLIYAVRARLVYE